MQSSGVSPNSPTVQERLREGIAAAKAGQRQRARDLLMGVVEEDEENLAAWLWLSGVVDSLDDREVCLENVLELDPGNEAARKGLAWVRQQKGTQPGAQPPLGTPSPQPPLWAALPSPSKTGDQVPNAGRGGSPAASPSAQPSPGATRRTASMAGAVLSGEFEQRYAIPQSERAPTSVDNEFDNEYLCPYCARPTRPEDKKCRSCGGALWVKFWRREKTSCLFRGVLALQILNALNYGLPLVALIVVAIIPPEPGATPGVGTLSPQQVAMLPLWIAIYAALTLYSGAVAVGLFMRWMIIMYLYIANAVLTLVMGGIMVYIMGAQGPTASLMCGGGVIFVALIQFGIIVGLEGDFAHDKRRILLRTDSDAIGAIALLDSGRRYAKRGMWALAALHLQRAVQMMPGELDYHLLLAGIYINLKRYELADKILTQAKRINPHDTQIERLAAIVAQHGGGQV
jgi:tetratricopeptide (TPR) repeat protein